MAAPGLDLLDGFVVEEMSYKWYAQCMTSDSDIHAPAFFMADHVMVESGKLYVNGGFWNRLNFTSYPAVSAFGVAIVLSIPWRALHQDHKFSVFFEDADGNRVGGDIGGVFKIGAAPDMKVGEESIMPISAFVNNFTIAKAGDYSAVLHVDGTEISRWTFHAMQVFSGAGITIPSINPEAI